MLMKLWKFRFKTCCDGRKVEVSDYALSYANRKSSKC